LRFYVEKHLQSWKVSLDHLPPVRLLALLRDPRDMYVSISAFRQKRREAGQRVFAMGQAPGESDEAWFARYARLQKERLQWIDLALRKGTMPVFRYEDLVLDLPGQARRIEDWLGVTLDPEAVAKDDRLRTRHVSAATPEASIGRWRTEMPAELVRRFNDELGDELKALGFDVPGPRSLRQRPAVGAAKASRPAVRTAPNAESETREKLPTVLETARGNQAKVRGVLEAVEDDQQEPRDALTTANQDRAKLRAALEAANMERAQLQRALDETERWLRHLERSRSWRITRPLRAAGAAFRRLSQWRTVHPRRRA
jgi:hypothetical protein